MYAVAQANVTHKDLIIKKNQRLKKSSYDQLPERLKVKFKVYNEPVDQKPIGYGEVIGDTPEEKALREKAVAEALKKAEEGVSQTVQSSGNQEDVKTQDSKKAEEVTKQPPERKK